MTGRYEEIEIGMNETVLVHGIGLSLVPDTIAQRIIPDDGGDRTAVALTVGGTLAGQHHTTAMMMRVDMLALLMACAERTISSMPPASRTAFEHALIDQRIVVATNPPPEAVDVDAEIERLIREEEKVPSTPEALTEWARTTLADAFKKRFGGELRVNPEPPEPTSKP